MMLVAEIRIDAQKQQTQASSSSMFIHRLWNSVSSLYMSYRASFPPRLPYTHIHVYSHTLSSG